MNALELEDIQSLIVRSHAGLDHAAFVLLQVKDPKLAGEWLSSRVDDVTCGYDRPTERALNIAFTHQGLEALGLHADLLAGFSREYQEGMVSPHRSRALGDHGASDPSNWEWGGTKSREKMRWGWGPAKWLEKMEAARTGSDSVHILLLVYADSENRLSGWLDELLPEDAGVVTIKTLTSKILPGDKEHFGFRDGISQPKIAGLKMCAPSQNTIAPGEFILGYLNEYGYYPDSPTIPCGGPSFAHLGRHQDLATMLPRCRWDTSLRDLGSNGTYLVFRQLHQRVWDFWKFLDSQAQETDGVDPKAHRVELASKMVGRWPSGAPLVLRPNEDVYGRLDEIHEQLEAIKDEEKAGHAGDEQRKKVLENNKRALVGITNADSFGYFEGDPDGVACPFGSHLRRANPRDTLIDDDEHTPTEKNLKNRMSAMRVSRHHRIIRRGRPYGDPATEWMDDNGRIDPDKLIAKWELHSERGLQFICVNTDIARQFEFIHGSWLNRSRFPALANEVDPLMGDADPDAKGLGCTFVAPGTLLRRRVGGIQRWVTVRGGAYFFLPGIRALRYLGAVGKGH